MTRTRSIVGATAFLLFAGSAGAALVDIDPFVGELQEGYETQPRFQFIPSYDIFGGTATVDQIGGGQGLHITTGWQFFALITPHGGDVFMGGAGVNYEYNFDTPAKRFGGYYGTNADEAGAMAFFYDADDNLLGMREVVAPIGDWAWNGWQSDEGISRLEIIANNQFNGFIMNDDLEYSDRLPAPGALALLTLFGLSAGRRRR